MGLDVMEFANELHQALELQVDDATVAGWRPLAPNGPLRPLS
jgi:hypothetical protein